MLEASAHDLGICQRCQAKPAEAVLKIGMLVDETTGKPHCADDRKLCMECIELERWQKPNGGKPNRGHYA